MSRDYHRRYREMLDYMGIKNPKVAEITGLDYSTVRKATSISGEFSRWAKLAVWVFEFMRDEKKDKCTYDIEKEYGKQTGIVLIKPEGHEIELKEKRNPRRFYHNRPQPKVIKPKDNE